MSAKRLIQFLAVAALPLFGTVPQAAAQVSPLGQGGPAVSLPATPPARGRPRIEIRPRRPLYRRCVDWYELQYRPSGTVLYPQMRCWWVRG